MSRETVTKEKLCQEVDRRRTFAIISHPDAGKTTLSEKLLLYAGAVDLAGAVRTRKNGRHATSDWMAMEQERGISITSTALQFDYQGYRFNLLDTPGHQDFSEDTYRTLMAVDSAIMVLDSAKGIEDQTKKLFQVCRMRNLPILTFINKMDHPGREPLDLLDEIEKVLGISTVPRNWPIGDGVDFQGVYDLEKAQVLRFDRTQHGQYKAPVHANDIDDPKLEGLLGPNAHKKLQEDVELLSIAGASFDQQTFLSGNVTPVFFGSALNNFGIEPFLDALVRLAPSPTPRQGDEGPIMPTSETFSGFIFKIQANMDPKHRDQVAFLRVCSGVFQKDMPVHHQRLGRQVRMTRPYRLFAKERDTVEEAYPGDVVGLVNPGLFTIGDSLSEGAPIHFNAIPRFHPVHFGLLINKDISRYKQFHKGLHQLEEEGVIQVLTTADSPEPILAAVGQLQFDVVVARLSSEYNVKTVVEQLPFEHARWLQGDLTKLTRPFRGTRMALDRDKNPVILLESSWELRFCERENDEVTFQKLS